MPFRDIVGHRRVLGLVSRALAQGTLPPSLILAGPQGIGKRRVALAIAQALNCQNPQPSGPHTHASGDALVFDACGACSACRRIDQGTFPDVVLLERLPDKSEISIDQARDATEQMTYRPFEGRRRVIVVDDAADMTVAGQNALLKNLEEPTLASCYVLVTAWPDSLLPTIRSRCALLRFSPLTTEELVGVLANRHGLSADRARSVALSAAGSLGRAIELSGDEGEVARRALIQALDEAGRAAAPADRVALGAVLAAAAGTGKRAAPDRDALAVHLRVLASLVRDLAVLTSGARGDALTNPDLTSELESLAGVFGCGRAVRAFQAVEKALGALERNASPKIVSDWLAFQL